MDLITIFLYSLFCIFVVSFTQRFYINKGVLDKINIRSSHNSIATRSGGISVFISIIFFSIYFYLIEYEIFDFSLLVPLSILVLIGLYDDFNSIGYKLKFLFQIIAAKIIIDNGLIIDNLHGVLGIYEINRAFAHLLTMFIIVGIINSINFIDGLDGLAISIVLFFLASFEFFIYTVSPFKNLSILLAISLFILYFFNYKKNNKIFLGDSGSLFLGGIVSIYVIYILSNQYIIKEEYDLHKILFIISILFYPFIDIVRIFFIRIIKNKSPFMPDKNHIHHKINDYLDSHIKSVSLIILGCFLVLFLFQIIF